MAQVVGCKLMSEKKQRSPFEEHIESDRFDLSHLGQLQDAIPPHPLVQRVLDALPAALDHRVYDGKLDARQQAICDQLAYLLVQRSLRQEYAEDLQELTDDELFVLLRTPLAVAMLAQAHLHTLESEHHTLDHQRPPAGEQMRELLAAITQAFGTLMRAITLRLRILFKRPV